MVVPDLAVDATRLQTICDRYGVARLEVFGSTGRGNAGADSDIDILYELAPGAGLGWDIEQLADELTELLGRRVDILSRQALHERLRDRVFRSTVAVCSVTFCSSPR